ncbi:MAG: response regulator [Methanoregula sp.]|nr:MAG: response regulator [Methanoregula sp.]
MSSILIVDDDLDIANIFKIFLSRDGHMAVTASDGKVCLEKVQQCKFDLILLDIMMAPMDGWETLENIKADPKTHGIPVIMVTGKPLEEHERAKYGDLFYQYLMKPVRRTELCDIVKGALKNN